MSGLTSFAGDAGNCGVVSYSLPYKCTRITHTPNISCNPAPCLGLRTFPALASSFEFAGDAGNCGVFLKGRVEIVRDKYLNLSRKSPAVTRITRKEFLSQDVGPSEGLSIEGNANRLLCVGTGTGYCLTPPDLTTRHLSRARLWLSHRHPTRAAMPRGGAGCKSWAIC